MVDLSKKDTNIYVNNATNNEINNEVHQEEVNQVVLNQEEAYQEIPTREIKQTVSNVNLNQTVANKQYDTFQLMGLTFKIIHKNFGEFIAYLAKSWGVCLVYILVLAPMPMYALMSAQNDSLTEQLDKTRGTLKINPNLVIVPRLDEFSIFILRMGFVVICIYTIMWLTVKTVVGIDTGIEDIESKKVSTSGSNAFLKLLAMHPVLMIFSILIRNIPNSSPFMTLALYIQIQIFIFLFKQYAITSYFEAEAKGKDVRDSLSNSYINLFFSKNGIIKKTVVGKILEIVIIYSVFLIIGFSILELVVMSLATQSTFLLLFMRIVAILIYVVILQYFTFYSVAYRYLVYMLNEVRDDKVDDLK